MSFYRPKLKWYHRLWNIIAFPIDFSLLMLFVLFGSIPIYIACGDRVVNDTAEHLFYLLNFKSDQF